METAWRWEDIQFSYMIAIDGDNFQFSKHLRHGGHLPTSPVNLAVSVTRQAIGSPQEGEERLAINLQHIRSAVLSRRPYRGYSAFRNPVITFSAMAIAIPVSLWAGRDGWTVTDWGWVIGAVLVASRVMEELFSRLLPHKAIVLTPLAGARPLEIDVHSMPAPQREHLLKTLETTLTR